MHFLGSKKIWLFLFLAPLSTLFSLSDRTWVSGTGTDAGTCTRAAPCATFGFALGQTSSGGEIDAVDSGLFGPNSTLNITQSITIDGLGAQAVLEASSIQINAAASDTIILRNLDFTGFTIAIQFNSGGQLIIENCKMDAILTSGSVAIEINNPTGQVLIDNCTFSNSGIVQAAAAKTTITNSIFATSVIVCSAGIMNISDCVISQNATNSLGIHVQSGGIVDCENCVLTQNDIAIQVDAGSTVRISNNDIFDNGTALTGAGTIASSNNNRLSGNTTSVDPNATLIYQ